MLVCLGLGLEMFGGGWGSRESCMQCIQFLLNSPKALSFRNIELLPADQRVKFISCVLEAIQLPNRDS